MKKNSNFAVALLVAAVLCVQVVRSAPSLQTTTQSSSYVAHRLRNPPSGSGAFQHVTTGGAKYVVYSPVDEFGTRATEQPYFWWVTEPWDGDDKPYVKARQAIDAAVKKGTKPLALSARYKAELSNDPWNPLKVYRWAYATWLARKVAATEIESRRVFALAGDYLPEVRFPNSYQFARMSFLAQAYNRPRLALKYVGDKLLRRNPNDEDVRYRMIRVLTSGRELPNGTSVYDPQDDARAFVCIAYFRKKYPNDAGYAWDYAYTKWYMYVRQHPLERKKAQSAVAALQSFSRQYPSYRASALAYIADIKRQQSNWEAWGYKNWLKEQAQRRAQP